MAFFKGVIVVFVSFILYIVDGRGIAGNIKLVAMNGNQYWFSSSSPYAPNLNYHLAYQYCRTLGLQLVVLETKEEVDTISAYLNSFEGSILNRNNYWTSGNRVGANSWLWMSSGEQLNGSFSDFPLLKQATDGPVSSSSKNCLSMKSTVAKRAIFTPDECEKSLPFICEQVRCLYYNYPVTQFPDPNDLRSDIEEGVGVTQSEAESRANFNFILNEKLRTQNYISAATTSRINANTLRLAQLASQNTRKADPSKIQRRITLRPVSSTFPYTATDYVNSFYKYKDYSATSTDRPSFKKTTRDSLWSPWPSLTDTLMNRNTKYTTTPGSTASTKTSGGSGSVTATIHKTTPSSSIRSTRNVTYVTSTALTPSSKSTVAITSRTTVKSPVTTIIDPLKHINSRRRANLEIVKIKATERSTGKNSVTSTVPYSGEKDSSGTTTFEVIYSRRGPNFRKATRSSSEEDEQGHTEITTLDPNQIVFDDEKNNEGGEVNDEDLVIRDSEASTNIGVTEPMFFQGNGIRRPDTMSALRAIGIPGRSNSVSGQTRRRSDVGGRYIVIDRKNGKSKQESSDKNPSTLRQQMQHFQRKAIRNQNLARSLAFSTSKSNATRTQSSKGRTRNSNFLAESRSVSVIANTGPTKIALGPRLKYRTKSASQQ